MSVPMASNRAAFGWRKRCIRAPSLPSLKEPQWVGRNPLPATLSCRPGRGNAPSRTRPPFGSRAFMSRRERQRRRHRNRASPVKRVVLMTAVVGICSVAVGVAGVAGWVVDVANSAPDISHLKPRDPGQISQVFAADGTRLGYIRSDVLRQEVTLKQIPRILTRATVAIEDRRFWQHG